MLKVTVDDKKARRQIRKLRKSVKDMRPAFNQVADQEIKNAQYRIRTSKMTPDGKQWQPWAYSTMKQRVREGNVSKGLLFKTGMLLNKFFKKVTSARLTISNKAPYARYLQEGTSRMPARPFLGWGKETVKQSEKTLLDYFKKALR